MNLNNIKFIYNLIYVKYIDMQSYLYYLLKLKMIFKKIKYIIEREIIMNEIINKLKNVFKMLLLIMNLVVMIKYE